MPLRVRAFLARIDAVRRMRRPHFQGRSSMARNFRSLRHPGLDRRGVASIEYAVLMAGLIGLAAATMPAMMRGMSNAFSAIGTRLTSEQARLRSGFDIQVIGGGQGDRAAPPR